MYCKRCRYDLRGQTNDRCPECGEWFDPGNPKTYSLTRPVFLGLEARHIRSFLWANLAWSVPLIVLLDLNAYHSRHSDGTRSHPNPAWYRSQFKSIALEWFLQRELDPNRSDFDVEKAATQLDIWIDRRSWRRRNEWDYWTSSTLWVPWLVVGVTLLGAMRSRQRRRSGAILVVFLLMTTGLSFCADSVRNRIWPFGYDYLQDYVYVSGLNWDQANTTTIIAFEREPWYGKFRHVAFADFHVVSLPEGEFRKLLAAQGLGPQAQ